MKYILDVLHGVYGENIDSETIKLSETLKEKFQKSLNDEDKKQFSKLIKAQEEACGDISRESFRQGFCASFMLMLEMLTDNPVNP